MSSTITFAFLRIIGSSSSLPAASAPIALIWVPPLIHSALTTGLFTGVVVTRISQSHTSWALCSDSISTPISFSISTLNATVDSLDRSNIFTFLISLTAIMARSCVLACLPSPIRPTTLESSLERYFAATPPAAPVRRSVRVVPSITARGAPVLVEFNTIKAMTVGSPIFGLSGCTFTSLTPAISISSR